MSTVTCKECSKEMNPGAHTCPYCGANNSKQFAIPYFVVGILGLGLLAFILHFVMSY